MNQTSLITVITLTLIAGLAMPLGAFIAHFSGGKSWWVNNELKHAIIAFGGGALMAAVALILIPQGIKDQSILMTSVYFCGGGLFFMLIDIFLYRIDTAGSQMVAMLSDFVPEALALGAAIALDSNGALLLTFLMVLQNLPEGFNAFLELRHNEISNERRLLVTFTALSLIGPVAGVAGYLWLAEQPIAISAIMLFAAGGILYSVFQDIAPQAKLDRHWLPALGAIAGFMLGLAGHMIIS